MIEISALSDCFAGAILPPEPEAESPAWEKVGRAALLFSSVSALSAFVPAVTKKRRIYTPQVGPITGAPPPIVEAENGEARPIEPIPPCSDTDAAGIRELFERIATRFIWSIPRLHDIGKELRKNNVHPFEFLRQAPRDHVRTIFLTCGFVQTEGVMFGVREGMNRERANLERYLPAFAAAMNKPAGRIRPLMQEGDWRGLVDYVFDITS